MSRRRFVYIGVEDVIPVPLPVVVEYQVWDFELTQGEIMEVLSEPEIEFQLLAGDIYNEWGTPTQPILPTALTTLGYWAYNGDSLDKSIHGRDMVIGSSNAYAIDYNQYLTMINHYDANYSKSIAPFSDGDLGLTGTEGSTITNCESGLTFGAKIQWGGTSVGSQQGIMAIGRAYDSNGFGIYLPYPGTDGSMIFNYGGVGGVSCGQLTGNTWASVIITIDKNDTAGIYQGKVYLNGVLTATQTVNMKKPTSANGVQIGCIADGSGVDQLQLQGNIDEGFLLNETWDSTKISEYYTSLKI